MARTKRIDSNTLVGYNYITNNFYVTNKETTTYRKTEVLTLQVLDIVAPTHTETVQTLQVLKTTLEPLQDLYYTWEDTGSYVKSIQINSYNENPIVLDAEKKKLYIMNTNLVFDLTLSESKASRVAYLQSYFKDYFGVFLSLQELESIYDFLISNYKPSVYNMILNTALPLTYSNMISLSNYTNTASGEYTCTCNPKGEYTNSNIGHIESTSSETNTITLTGQVPSTVTTNTKVVVNGTITSTGYSADGEYEVDTVVGNSITTKSPIPVSYSFNYPQVYITSSQINIQSINRETLTITLTNPVPNTIQVGDIIYVRGTEQTTQYETVTCDGSYTVGKVEGNNIIVQEMPSTNYTYTSGTYPTVSKRLFLGNVANMNSTTKVITFTENIQQVSPNTKVVLVTNTISEENLTVVETSTIVSIKVSESITSYTPNYPNLQLPVPSTDILISISKSSNTEKLPTGLFMVDNQEQCKAYLGLVLPTSEVPSNTIFNQVNKEVPSTYPTQVASKTMKLLGIFSSIYTS